MSKIARWAALAVFCAAFGLLGSVGGILLMQGHLEGEAGPTGPAGPVGESGPAGPPGATGPAADTTALKTEVDRLNVRVSTLELGTLASDDCTIRTQLVTDADTLPGFDGPTLHVYKTPFQVCVNPAQ